MNDRQVPQADWVRYINTLGSTLGVSSLVSLEEESLLQVAMDNTGLSDFGDSGFRELLAALVKSLEEEAELTLTGRILVATDLLRILESRLRIVDTEKLHPEIAQEQINSPIFVLGMGRTGTTILHELLAQDPANRAPLLWEMMCPAPPTLPGSLPGEKLAIADAAMKMFDEVDPSYVSKHEGGGDLTNECSYMMMHEFFGTMLFGCQNVPSFAYKVVTKDATPAFKMHKRILQMLQWQHAPKRWVLKDPNHLSMLPTLLSVYPDAKMVHTHRDPEKVIHSTNSMMASLRLMRSDHFDAGAAAEMSNAGQSMSLKKVIADRTSGVVPESQIADLFFQDFLKDPVAEVEKLYQHWGLDFSEAARNGMQSYIDARPRSKHGKHEYAYADAVNLDAERERFKNYMDHYSIEKE